jgi:hypothetical protein
MRSESTLAGRRSLFGLLSRSLGTFLVLVRMGIYFPDEG